MKKELKVWVVTVNGVVLGSCYTSLRASCDAVGVSYWVASRGKRLFIDEKGEVIRISEVEVIRIKGRGGFVS